MIRRRRHEWRAMHVREQIRQDDEAASRLASKGRDGHFDLCVAMNGRHDWHELE